MSATGETLPADGIKMPTALPAGVIRFAPAPTRLLHSGRARLALFNGLSARHHAPRFRLLIESTARARFTDVAVAAVLDRMRPAALGGLVRSFAETVAHVVRDVAKRAELGLVEVAQPLWAALSGRATSPGKSDVLVLLGREESLQRLGEAIAAPARS